MSIKAFLTLIVLSIGAAIVAYFTYRGSMMAGFIVALPVVIPLLALVGAIDAPPASDDDDDFGDLIEEQHNLHVGPFKDWIP